MSGDLQILVKTPSQLVVHSPTYVFSLPLAFGMLLGTIIFGGAYLTNPSMRSPAAKRYLIFLWLLVICSGIVFGIWSHTVTFTRPSNDVTVVDRFAGIAYATHHYPLNAIREAIIQSARPGTRIALITQGGGVILPLGAAYNPKPSQYKVVDLINDFVQSGTTDTNRESAMPNHLRELREEIEKTKRENEEKLRKYKAEHPQQDDK
jgi:hypothetical protein